MRAKHLVLSALAASALWSGATASAAAAPDTASFSSLSTAGATHTAPVPVAGKPVGARAWTQVPEPETYALILAGLLFVGLRTRAQRP